MGMKELCAGGGVPCREEGREITLRKLFRKVVKPIG